MFGSFWVSLWLCRIFRSVFWCAMWLVCATLFFSCSNDLYNNRPLLLKPLFPPKSIGWLWLHITKLFTFAFFVVLCIMWLFVVVLLLFNLNSMSNSFCVRGGFTVDVVVGGSKIGYALLCSDSNLEFRVLAIAPCRGVAESELVDDLVDSGYDVSLVLPA